MQEKIERLKSNILWNVFILLSILILILLMLNINSVKAADPGGPDSLNITSNETKSANSAVMVNISGGYIASLNLSATIQNPRWKAFVGWVTGKFTLDDAAGSTIYDWTLSSITGRVYTTRKSGSVSWSNIDCANSTFLSQEDNVLNHTNANDNITITFNATNDSAGYGTHSSFWVGSTFISANSCPTLNTYIENQTQDNADFEEMALYDGTNIVYATILEDDLTGYDSQAYDFQMIVPENGAPDFDGATAYYVYVEIGT